MDYEIGDIGPALKRLRKAAGLAQNRLADKIRRSNANVSRLEQPGSNPKLATLLRYLAGIDADLGDLHRELQEPGDPLEETVANVERRLEDEPAFRELARAMIERFGGPEPPPALRALADLIDRQAEQIERQKERLEDYDERLRRLEEGSMRGEGPALPDGSGQEPPDGQ